MSLMTYAYLVGAKHGQVKGSVTQRGREDSIGVIAVSHRIVAPRDPSTGQASGKRKHESWMFTKELDKSTPILFHMLCTNEVLPTATFKFWAVDHKGGEAQHYTVKLTNATVGSQEFRQLDIRNLEFAKHAEYEEVHLTYQSIEWTWNDGGITAMDGWNISG